MNTLTPTTTTDIVHSNLLLGLDGALQRITLQLSQLYKPSPSMLTKRECADIVRVLNNHSLFLLRDSMNIVFRILPITKPSIYRYIKIQNNNFSKVNTFWNRTFSQARNIDGWMIVPRTYTKRSAFRLTTDIRNAYKKVRPTGITGLLPAEMWETKWTSSYDEFDKKQYTVSIRLIRSPLV